MFKTTDILNEDCHSQPRSTALLACGENFMPASWHMPVSRSPFRYAVAVRSENKTYDLLHDIGDFSLNFLDQSYIEAYDTAGSMHGGDKFGATALTRKKAQSIHSVLIEEAYMIYECKIVEVVNFGDHDVYVADVKCIHNKDIVDVSPMLFLGRGYYETISKKPKRIKKNT